MHCVSAPDVPSAARPSKADALLPSIRVQHIQGVNVNNILPSNPSISYARQGADAARLPDTASARASVEGARSSSGGVTLGKRTHRDVAAYLANQSDAKKPPTEKSPTDVVKLEVEQWMTKNYKDACASLVEHICQKIPVSTNEQGVACCEMETKILVGEWETRAKYIQDINKNGLGTLRKLTLTSLLVKIVRDCSTYEEACKLVRTVSSLGMRNPVGYLTEKAQAYCRGLKEKDGTLPELPTDPYSSMALIALHEKLTGNDYGYELRDVVKTTNKNRNSGVLPVLASDIMNQPPFTSSSDRDNLSETDRTLSIARKVKIACHEGAVATIFAIRKHFPALQALGFEPDQVLNIANHNSAANVIEAVATHGVELLEKDFSHEQIVMIASRGTRKIGLILEYCDALLKKGHEHGEIVALVMQRAKVELIEAELQHCAAGEPKATSGSVGDDEQAWSDDDRELLFNFMDTAPDTASGAEGGGAQERRRG
jgi:hypothetical protein